jgi:hypothetical protein
MVVHVYNPSYLGGIVRKVMVHDQPGQNIRKIPSQQAKAGQCYFILVGSITV